MDMSYIYNMYRHVISLIIGLLISASCIGSKAYYFEYTDAHRSCYELMVNLDIQNARQLIADLQASDPYNMATMHIENYVDFFELFILEDKGSFKRLKRNKNRRIRSIKKHLPSDNAYRNFAIAEINLQWSLARSKFGELFRAGHELYTAYKYLEKNSKMFPDFQLQKKSTGIVYALIETVDLPGLVKGIFGIDASINLAINEIESFIQWGQCEENIFMDEAIAIYSYILFYQNLEKEKALEVLLENQIKGETALLEKYLTLNLLMKNKENDKALSFIEQNLNQKDFQKIPYLHFMYGNCLLRNLDPKSQDQLNKFIKRFKGEHYLKEAHQKLAWSHLIFSKDSEAYKSQMQLVLTTGNDLMDGDKQSVTEAMSGKTPDLILLKSRLLFDGGYYEEALATLDKFEERTGNLLEYKYRKARILQEQSNHQEALKIYRNLINEQKSGTDYRICNAALQSGIIYEQRRNLKEAKRYFDLCLKLKPQDYKRSLHQKAKSGLERLEKW